MSLALDTWEAAKLAATLAGAPCTNPALGDVPRLAADMAEVADAARKVKPAQKRAERDRVKPTA
jgi:hypothetical protein